MVDDTCRPVVVTGEDGEPVTVQVLGAQPLTGEGVAALEVIVQAALRRHRREHPRCLDPEDQA